MRSVRRVPGGIRAALLLPALLASATACEGDAMDLVREIEAARGDCTAEGLRASSEECVRMFERYAEMGTEVVNTYVGALRAMDEALRRNPGLGIDTTALPGLWKESYGGAPYPGGLDGIAGEPPGLRGGRGAPIGGYRRGGPPYPPAYDPRYDGYGPGYGSYDTGYDRYGPGYGGYGPDGYGPGYRSDYSDLDGAPLDAGRGYGRAYPSSPDPRYEPGYSWEFEPTPAPGFEPDPGEPWSYDSDRGDDRVFRAAPGEIGPDGAWAPARGVLLPPEIRLRRPWLGPDEARGYYEDPYRPGPRGAGPETGVGGPDPYGGGWSAPDPYRGGAYAPRGPFRGDPGDQELWGYDR